MSGHGKTGSSMPEGEEVERQDPRQVKAYCQASGSSQRPKYVLVVHLLGHNFFSVWCINSCYTDYVICL